MTGRRPRKVTICIDVRSTVDFSVLLRGPSYKTRWGDAYKYHVKVSQEDVEAAVLPHIDPSSCQAADVIVVFYDYRNLHTSAKIIIDHYDYANFQCIIAPRIVPILFVGVKGGTLKMEDKDMFPFESLDPFLARCLGTVKYAESSSGKSFDNVHEVIKEALRCTLIHSCKSNFEDTDRHLFTLKIITSAKDYHWSDLCNFYLNALDLLPLLHPYFRQYVRELQEQIPSKMQKDSRTEVSIYRVLELDRLKISHGLTGIYFDVRRESLSPPNCSLWYIHNCSKDPTQIVQCRLFSLAESHENVVCPKCPANLRFFATDCKSVASFLLNSRDQLKVRSLVIVNCYGILDLSFLAKLAGLEYLIIVNTEVDLANLTFPPHLHDTMKHLVMNNCGITQATDVPSEIGKLANLQILNLSKNNFKTIPTTLGSLEQLHTLLIDLENVYFPPPAVLGRSLPDVISYLAALKEHPVPNTESKLIIVGQEGVGKSTLVKAMKRSRWFTKNEPPPKTDGVDISVLSLDDIQCKVYDLAGDVEYLNTHSLFLSSNTLHLVVYDLIHVIVDKGARSADHLCRLELWLETIASQDPKSKVILVGTYADHPLVNTEIIKKNRKILADVLKKYCSSHRAFCLTDPCKECLICNPEKCPENLECLKSLMINTSSGGHPDALNTPGQIPHILGYLEVSSIKKYPRSPLRVRNTNVDKLKSLAVSSISDIMETTGIHEIPERWLLFREYVAEKLSSEDDLKQQPLMSLSLVHDIALKVEIHKEERVIAMLRFFHSQGTYLWYEDLPEMKDIVILDPQWLSDQLRTLISYRPSVSAICDGVLQLSELSTVWPQMSDDNRRNLLALFRNVGLCSSISDTEVLFPCTLPVGWPNRDMWPPVPNRGENQTSLLFKFSFVPPSFFPDVIVEVYKKKETFARNVMPLYYRFHIVYITKDQGLSTSMVDCDADVRGDACTTEDDDACPPTQHAPVLHTVHYELMPYNNSLTVAIRGPVPSSIIPDIRTTIEAVIHRRYPGITYSETLLCPECVMKRVQPPASFRYDIPHDGVCSRGHKVGSNQDIYDGRYSSAEIVPSAVGQIARVVGQTLEDHHCPKLFVVLPINLEGLSFKDRFVYSYIRDGFAVHLLCECPDQWHFVNSPGFRVGKPKEFFHKYGNRVCQVLQFIVSLSTPITAASAIDPNSKIGVAVGRGVESVTKDLQSLLDSYLDKYPHLKPSLGSPEDDLKSLKSSSGLQRSELARFLEVDAKGRNFGPLVCTYVDKRDEWLWLCEEHNEMFYIP